MDLAKSYAGVNIFICVDERIVCHQARYWIDPAILHRGASGPSSEKPKEERKRVVERT